MKLYNSLSKKLEEFQPLKKGSVGLYTCGPTVYDHVHIGNLRTYIFEDTLRRMLKLSGLNVQHVMNITDIEDKIFTRSKKQYPNEPVSSSYKKLTNKFEELFFEDTKKLAIDLVASTIIRATDAISDMQTLVLKIPNKYITDDGVYFDISEYPDYGVFTKLDTTHEHHRINNDEYDKNHVADFALWKVAKGDEPSWDFKIDGKTLNGRPGWHLECSAMATRYLGQPFDIHTGGIDLKFPHHENEIAQSKSANGNNLATTFVHAEHLLVDGKKMSKSLNNFYTLEDIIKKGYNPLAFRLLILQAHYRSQLNFSWESLQAAQSFLLKVYEVADLSFQTQPGDISEIQLKNMLGSLQDDLNTPAVIAELARFIENNPNVALPKALIEFIDASLGLAIGDREDASGEQKVLIKQRNVLRDNGDFAGADVIRTQLKADSILLNDTAKGTFWYRAI